MTPVAIKDKLFCQIADDSATGCAKITIIGAGRVGMSCAICILSQKISNELCLIDTDENRVKGEILDLQHGSQFLHNAKITGGADISISANSRIYIITAGVASNPEESRLALLERNAAIIRKIIPQIVKISPQSIILMVTNPVDILTHLAWKLSGFPKNRVIGSGTSLDSARFRFLISQRLNIAPSSCEAFVIGEHGDTSVAVWSAVSVSGVNLRDLDQRIGIYEDYERWNTVREGVVNAANDVIKMKGCTNWAIGLCCAAIVDSILKNDNVVIPVSTSVKGMYGIDKNVFLSLPCALNANGITSIVKLILTPYEVELLQNSANVLYDIQRRLKDLLD